MKFLVAILALLISTAAFSDGGYKVRDRYTDEHGMPYGGQNPPVGVGPGALAHCRYSAYGCSGRGGSLGPRGYRVYGPPVGYPVYGASNPYTYTAYGPPGYAVVYPGYGPGGCGSTNVSGGNVAVVNGNVAGSVYVGQSRGNCGPNGYYQQSRGMSIGVGPGGNVVGGAYFQQSSSTP